MVPWFYAGGWSRWGAGWSGTKTFIVRTCSNNAYIVLDDADVEKAVAAGAFGSYFFQGQICFEVGRHLVHQRVYRRHIELLKEPKPDLRAGDAFRDQVELWTSLNKRHGAPGESIVQRRG